MTGTNIVNNSNVYAKPQENRHVRLDIIIERARSNNFTKTDGNELKGLIGIATLQQLHFLRDFIKNNQGLVEDPTILDDINNKITDFESNSSGEVGQLSLGNDNGVVTVSLSSDYSMQGNQIKNMAQAQFVEGKKSDGNNKLINEILTEKMLSAHSVEGLC